MTKIKHVLNVLIGSREEFSIGNRVFHTVGLITLLMLSIVAPFNFIIDLNNSGWISVASGLMLLFLYYLSRFRKRFKETVFICAISCYIVLSLNYYYNSGISGPTFYIFFFIFQLLVAITPRKNHWVYMLLHSVVGAVLIYTEYAHPDWIQWTYLNREDHFLDIFISYLLMLVFAYLITRSLLDNYYHEKKLSDEKALDIALKNRELEKLNQEKDKLFSIISHDFRSPLTSIQSYLELLASGELDKEEDLNFRQQLYLLTKNTSDMLQNMLVWAKDQMGNTAPNLQPVEVRQVIDASLQLQQPAAMAKDISITVTCDPSLMILADPEIMHLLLMNLLNNAIKFSPEHAAISVDAYPEGNECIIRVKDNGIGIPLEKQASIFSIGIYSTYGTNNEKGTGLGLMLCKQFAERQHGRIWFSSIPGEGAEFFLSTPLYQ